jgi:hypothetical protein
VTAAVGNQPVCLSVRNGRSAVEAWHALQIKQVRNPEAYILMEESRNGFACTERVSDGGGDSTLLPEGQGQIGEPLRNRRDEFEAKATSYLCHGRNRSLSERGP